MATLKKPSVVYYMEGSGHARVYSAIQKSNELDQIILMVNENKTSSINTELPLTVVSNTEELYKTIKRVKPDIVVMSHNSPKAVKKFKSMGLKVVRVNHGTWNTVNSFNRDISRKDYWNSFDLLCGAHKGFYNNMVDFYKVPSNKVVIDALTQLDFLYKTNEDKGNLRAKLLSRIGLKYADKVVTVFGKNTLPKYFVAYNKGYSQIISYLSKIAEKNNWAVVIKPVTNIKTKEFLGRDFESITNNPHIFFADSKSNPYEYMVSSDAIICTAKSSIEIESCLVGVPLIIRRINFKPSFDDPMEIRLHKCVKALPDSDISQLRDVILDLINDKNIILEQQKYIKKLGITFDGNAHKRLQKAMINLMNRGK